MTSFSVRLLVIAPILMGMISCVSMKPFGAEDGLRLEEDEKRLWNRSKELVERLDKSGELYRDPVLTAYVNDVAKKLVPENLKQRGLSFQIKILKNPLMNAFALAHGTIYLHTGLLAKMENEAQLATLLGHEMSHAIDRHQLQQFRTVQNTAGTLTAIQIIFMPFGVFGSIGSLLAAGGALAAVSGYSRAQETEADTQGLALTVAAGYDPKEAPRLFDHLKRDLEESKKDEPFFFGNHPRLAERKDSYNRLLEEKYAGVAGAKGAEGFMERISNLLLDNAAFDMSLGRFALAQEAIEKFLQNQPRSGTGHYYLGEVWRQKNPDGDLAKAENEYKEAAEYDPALAPPHRGLGLIWLKLGKKQDAKRAFEKYLSLAPTAAEIGRASCRERV